MFKDCGDERGQMWAEVHLGRLLLRDEATVQESVAVLHEALKYKAETGECTSDYLQGLKELAARTDNMKGELGKRIRSEWTRVEQALREKTARGGSN
jgi:hypothetical protein